ncbi:nucleoside transporter C-terminal domain-containing protein [Cytophagaceae bacterium DM2B3-1]|uniref:Nucleoside transporter C-terminal domain-containing protein n=2 Tax=Xanthocytophaga TaxID=3078918 RepID=A0AAE3QLP4_9BACT|nr:MULTISPECIES: nucleoside transporter C-terminal domain-containing protein [Xanthocytophaga]MDJ1466392.1 nucleoside transporter C-terminal domain-containing protein [Xanthocytophaga flavus]MDJ1479049.1 nucleoside transporter C-terminal domain-containing protein [Xanthocytophaga flavus]MDJ1497899.1 nucleoside transporter C-terminal domain-containing protein [Xanthocytophaga flavus]MDJ1500563.1 nucleoside transporter C-terminal domain-containing protein [Xanthocytophaga agilis]
MIYLRGVFGLAFLIAVAYMFSSNRKAIDWKLVGTGILLQLIFGLLVIKVDVVADGFDWISRGFVRFLDFSAEGAKFLFGDLTKDFAANDPKATHHLGYLFAFRALPTIIFFSAVTSGLYYLGILQKVVYGIAWVMSRTMRLSGAESFSAAGNIFLGQTEAPLLVRPFVPTMTRSELLCLMIGGMANIAGSVMGAYVNFLGGDSPESKAEFAAHLLSASIMSAPAGILISKILLPETESIDQKLVVHKEQLGVNIIDAMSIGAADGLKLALNVGGMLIAFIAVVYMVNAGLSSIGDITGLNAWVKASTEGTFKEFSLEYIFGQVFRLFAFVMGIEWKDTLLVGSLLGQKTVINEFVAYLNLAEMQRTGVISRRSVTISTYALCSFANFSSIAIQVGGIGNMAPNQQGNLSKLGMTALLGGTLTTMMTATIAGTLIEE